MNIRTLYCKLHNAVCTESRLDYMGSITIDQNWMEVAKLHENQAVDVLNLDNGSRITTYAITGKRGCGEICLNGAAAHYFQPGHRVIIIVYCDLTLEEKKDFQPQILLFTEPPPFVIDQQQKKLSWIQEIPQYHLLSQETHSTTYQDLAMSSHLPLTQCDRCSNTFNNNKRDHNLVQNWKLVSKLLWDETELVASLETFVQENKIASILDVSGDNGFPLLKLNYQGKNKTDNEVNLSILPEIEAQTKINQDQILATITYSQVYYEHLDQQIINSDSYDLIMCRNNSLSHGFSLSVNTVDVSNQAKIIKKALTQFYQNLNPGGFILIDKSKFESAGFHVIDKERIVDGKKCRLHWVFVNNLDSGIQRWDQYITLDQQTTCLTVYSLLLTEKMLFDWLTEIGFVSICQTAIKGQNIYNVYTARKLNISGK